MDSYALFPDRRRLLRGVILCTFFCGLALVAGARVWALPGATFETLLFAGMVYALAAMLGTQALRAAFLLVSPAPAFEGDEAGFSVMGRRRRPWTSYRATRTEGVLGAHLPLRWVTIESGERLGRFQTIPGFALPDTPQKTAQSIAAIAARQQWVAARVAEMAVADRPGRRLRGGESPPEFGRKRPAGFGGGPFTRRRSL